MMAEVICLNTLAYYLFLVGKNNQKDHDKPKPTGRNLKAITVTRFRCHCLITLKRTRAKS